MNEIYLKLSQSSESDKDVALFKELLEAVRAGNTEAHTCLKMLIQNDHHYLKHCLEMLTSDDIVWLKDSNNLIFDALILWGKFNKYLTWGETFTDEKTNETVQIFRSEQINSPLFKISEEEEQEIFERICNLNYDGDEQSFKCIFHLLYQTRLDYVIYLNALQEKYPTMRWPYEELGDIYRWGCERLGYFINKDKAKEYYLLAQITDINPLDDKKSYAKYEITPTAFKFTIKDDATDLKNVIEMFATEASYNEFGIFSPISHIMHHIVDTDVNQPEYLGIVQFVTEENGNLIIEGEANNPYYFKYAIEKCYQLRVEHKKSTITPYP